MSAVSYTGIWPDSTRHANAIWITCTTRCMTEAIAADATLA